MLCVMRSFSTLNDLVLPYLVPLLPSLVQKLVSEKMSPRYIYLLVITFICKKYHSILTFQAIFPQILSHFYHTHALEYS